VTFAIFASIKTGFSFWREFDFYLGAIVKTFLLTGAAVFGLFGASALASDLPTKAPAYKTPIAAPPYNWSGFYVGATSAEDGRTTT
jgi:hypothetical protein